MRILVIEDNKDLCDAMCFQLRNEGYITDSRYTGEDALYYVLQQSYDVIILDRMLPVMDGLTILKTLRQKNSNVPVIMVTAMDGLHDRVDGLDSGADDYLVKPFDMEELLARIRALVRRPPKIEQTEILCYTNMKLDIKKQLLLEEENTCSLSRRETELLEYFMRNQNQVISRERILSHVWGPDTIVESGNLDNYIYFLRRRLKSVTSSVRIKTVHGVGYRLE
jgi:two-component system OmpR family response regulator